MHHSNLWLSLAHTLQITQLYYVMLSYRGTHYAELRYLAQV